MIRIPQKQAGFTLVEMILSVTLMGLLLVMAYSSLNSGTKAIERGEQKVDKTNRVRVVQQFLRGQISRMLPLVIESEEGLRDETEFIIFEGEDDAIRFVSAMPGYLGQGGPHVQQIWFESGALMFDHRLLGSDEDADVYDDREPIVLINGIRSGEFSFLTVDEEGEPTDWANNWEEPNLMPLMIKIDVEMERESRIFWPSMEIAMLIDSSVSRRPLDRPFVIPSEGSSGREGEPSFDRGGDEQ